MASQLNAKNGTDSQPSHHPALNVHWFRNDLRLHDNPALWHTIQLSSSSSPSSSSS
eukprot:CAMPEP_0201662040 /NCGR_PEP_ID=MMETSP0494-20130426/4252_1 /ASSEMBLY_ACC=CAM_ASM_000839 /TAXON_ID=420259 /ORGANISM="Thalassiosira gravida, Strain GMp14c1" /LENGTH=55 /DNA_ID=CAMNT_0048140319 /DNA_START=40 /DNA_END=203 /DNA_ORIENTATION=+